MPSAGFETEIPAIKRPQTYALDRKTTGIGERILATHFRTIYNR
jgi:hypothetical protein